MYWNPICKWYLGIDYSLEILLKDKSAHLYQILDHKYVFKIFKADDENAIKLWEYFSLTKERVSLLIELITIYPPEDSDYNREHKYPFIASEIFRTEFPPLLDIICLDLSLMIKLFNFLEVDYSTLTGYCSNLNNL